MSRAKKAMLHEDFYDLSEDEIQEIIARAQGGEGAAYQELIQVFSNYLDKYIALLYNCKYSLLDYDVRRFLGMFIKDPALRRAMNRKKMTSQQRKDLHQIVYGLVWIIQRYCDIEDVRQTVHMTFIDCTERYRRQESKTGAGFVPFSGYIYSYMYYILKKNVEKSLLDQLGRKSFPLITEEEANEDWDSPDKQPGFIAPPEPSVEDVFDINLIDEQWVAGDTAMFPFDCLNVQERQLLKWRYVNEKTATDISRMITEHPNTVRDHFYRIRNKLKEALQEMGETDRLFIDQ